MGMRGQRPTGTQQALLRQQPPREGQSPPGRGASPSATCHRGAESTRLSLWGSCPVLFLNRSEQEVRKREPGPGCTRDGEPAAGLWDRVWKAPGGPRAGGAPPPQRPLASPLRAVRTRPTPAQGRCLVWPARQCGPVRACEPGLCLPALHTGCTWLRWVGAPAGSLGLERCPRWGRGCLGCSLGTRMVGGWEGGHVGGAPSQKKE